MGVCCRVHTGSAAPSGLYRLSSAAQRSGCRVGGMPTGYGQMAPKDLGSWILSFPPNKPKAEPWGNQGAAVTMQNRLQSEAWGRTPQPPHSRDTGRGEAATATFRWDQGWTPAAPRETPWACGRGPPPSRHLDQPLHLVRTSQGPQSVTLGAASSGSQWFPPQRAAPPETWPKPIGPFPLWLSLRRRVPSVAVGSPSWRCTLRTVSCAARTREVGRPLEHPSHLNSVSAGFCHPCNIFQPESFSTWRIMYGVKEN